MKNLTRRLKSNKDLEDDKQHELEKNRIQAAECLRIFFMSREHSYQTHYRGLYRN